MLRKKQKKVLRLNKKQFLELKRLKNLLSWKRSFYKKLNSNRRGNSKDETIFNEYENGCTIENHREAADFFKIYFCYIVKKINCSKETPIEK